MESELEPAAFDLVHAGLVLEYVDWSLLLPRVAATLKPGGILSVVLQLPSASNPGGDANGVHESAVAGVAVPLCRP